IVGPVVIMDLDPSAYETGTLAVGEVSYIDRTYTFTDVGSLDGETYIRTACDDKYNTDAVFLTFDVGYNVVVYVAYDDRHAQPGWLSSWTDENDQLVLSGGEGLDIFSKQFAAGSVSLPGNRNSDGMGNAMYSVVVKADGPPPPDTEAPSVPQNLAATAPAYNRVDLTWDASTDNVGVTGYEVYRDSGLIGTSAGPSYTDNTVVAETTYRYSLLAFDAAGNKSVLIYSLDDVTTPEQPAELVISNIN
ncbi:MAG: fibronectin type III domain-containing protein, partial [Propionibacteriaceae bacterium]|nr:fibronectin type III domain-containing protein [Propionibacteriaceae bacterium]